MLFMLDDVKYQLIKYYYLVDMILFIIIYDFFLIFKIIK